MKIEQLMTRDVATCGPDDSLHWAAQLMWERDCGCIPVLGDDNRVAGMITDRDCCMAAFTRNAPLTELRVGDIMAKQVYTCHPDESLHEAENRMRNFQVRRLPVVDAEGVLQGIVSLNDIALEAERDRSQPQPAVSGTELTDTLAGISRHRHAPEAPAPAQAE